MNNHTKESSHRLVVISTLVATDNNKMLLVRKNGASSFILPGGKPEIGETNEDAVRREVKEELGCQISDLVYVGAFRDEAADAPGIEVIVHVHTGRLCSDPAPQAEICEMIWCDMTEPQVMLAPSLSRQIIPFFIKGKP